MKKLFLQGISFSYRNILKKALFRINAESVHISVVKFGETLGRSKAIKGIASSLFAVSNKALEQKIAGITFKNPIGLSAGFDYEARLTQILPSVGFGFATVGTITNLPCPGNPSPQLGRLPKSKSLMVNKGFKNLGAVKTIEKLANLSFEIPIGISIGRTNNKDMNTQKKSIDDIIKAFALFEKGKVKNSYYELNISCPNLSGNVTFYPPKNLRELLLEIDKLHLKKPLFIKMPIEKSDEETLKMLWEIDKHSAEGVIFGNLQKDRKNECLDKEEVMKFKIGNFSGKPTFRRSNELIKLAYRNFKNRFVIIGCGGIFSGKDAYEKISLGASLVQLITGMVFNGPQLISQINLELLSFLKRDGLTNIKEAIGRTNAKS